jgi:hypothetical protein
LRIWSLFHLTYNRCGTDHPFDDFWCRLFRKRKQEQQLAASKKAASPQAMTPSAAYPYYDSKPMQFRGVKVRAEPPVRATFHCLDYIAAARVQYHSKHVLLQA